jgi:ABC-type dipeptide/oligopeptide/nickel transport system ATPase component
MSAIAIVGESGTGKSTSMGKNVDLNIEGLDPAKTVLINVANKDLPFKGWKNLFTPMTKTGGNLVNSDNADVIAKTIEHISANMPNIKHIVIDDGQFVMAFEFMARAKESGYGKFADIGVNQGKIIKAAKNTRQDLEVYFLWHPEKSDTFGYKMKSVGKMVDDYLTLEGLFAVVLYSIVQKEQDKISYKFVTNQDGKYPAKSPHGMFKDLYINNDLGLVSKAITDYNNG